VGARLVVGFYLQLSALLLAGVMAGAIWMKTTKWHVPFVATDKTGRELDLIFLPLILLFFSAGGRIKI